MLVPSRWTSRPKGYVTTGFDAYLDSGGDLLRGEICDQPFTARRR